MEKTQGQLIVSPSDLVAFLECGHLTALDLESADRSRGPSSAAPQDAGGAAGDADDLAVLQRRGLEHEASYLERLEEASRTVVVIDEPEGADRVTALRRREAETATAMRDGADVVFQATFFDESQVPSWRGHADFLIRTDALSSDLGPFAYEPEDTKLARRVKASAVLQLCEYARQIERIQGVAPPEIRVVLGTNENEAVRLVEVAAYHRVVRARFVTSLEAAATVYPVPVSHCGMCRWQEQCRDRWEADDHLSRVAKLTREQVRKLEAQGVTTMTALAGVEDGRSITGIGDAALFRLRRQARLQRAATAEAPPPFEALAPEHGQGLAGLPEPDPGDLFYDIEGDPHVGDQGIEYLHGFGWEDQDGTFGFRSWWAHTPREEKRAFEQLIDFITARRREHPDMHVYHYAPYEKTALGKLMGRYGTREDELDDLLRGEVFVDLYRVVRQGVAIGTDSYSIKKLEPLYMPGRTASITDAGSSIVEYERWLDESDETVRSQILDEIEAYNRDDVESTWLLRGWLEARRDDLVATGVEVDRPTIGETVGAQDDKERSEEDEYVDDLMDRLTAGLAETPEQDAGAEIPRRLMANLLRWHQREAKPEWWTFFERVQRFDADDLFADTECISGLVQVDEPVTDVRSRIWTYEFDADQEFKLGAGSKVVDPATERTRLDGGTAQGLNPIHALDADAGRLQLRQGQAWNGPHPTALVPNPAIGHAAQEASLQRTAEALLDHGVDGSGPAEAARRLLGGLPPRIDGVGDGDPVRAGGEASLDAAVSAARGLRRSVLPVQGPPGAGKTFTAAHMILALIGDGHRVGITANSHSVISTLLEAVLARAAELGADVAVVQKVSESGQGLEHPAVERTTKNPDVLERLEDGAVDIVAGTAWLFAREEMAESLHTLFVDEAGQLSLANVVAVAPAAENLVLVGDPQQLAQPSKGVHPPGAGASGLDHVLGGLRTIPADRGLFLDRTWRMHPAITAFASEQVYEGRLSSKEHCAGQVVADGPIVSGAGLRWLPVTHTGNRTSSVEEADALGQVFDALVGRSWVDDAGDNRAIGIEDVLVVAPYNAQVRRLADRLPAGARVGTVDKFQGKEGAVVLVSLASSGAADAPRGMEFLYSRNRLNVAVSRARALSVIVASPDLLTVRCRSVAQMRLANVLCRYVEMAETVSLPV